MKECELCEMAARMYCESDEASLCWKCDAKVHGANFLVARHSRSLLCQVCQAVTPWRASGSNPGPTVSVCEKCVARSREKNNDGDGNDENQVVPFASGVSGPPPSSPSTEDEEEENEEEEEEENEECEGEYVESFALISAGSVSGSNPVSESSPLKRTHETSDLRVVEGDDNGCSCSGPSTSTNWASSRSGCEDDANSFGIRRLKKRKEEDHSNNVGVVDTLERIQREGISSSTTVSAICKLCDVSRPRDLVSVSSIDSYNILGGS